MSAFLTHVNKIMIIIPIVCLIRADQVVSAGPVGAAMLMKGAVLGGAALKAKIATKAAKVAVGTAKIAVGTAKVAVGTAKVAAGTAKAAVVGTAKAAVGTGVAAVGTGVAAGMAVATTEKKLAVSGLGLAASKLAGIPSQFLNTSGSYKGKWWAEVAVQTFSDKEVSGVNMKCFVSAHSCLGTASLNVVSMKPDQQALPG